MVKFINMGVDASWGSHILEKAASALPVLEDLIGAPLPPQVQSIEIYGKKELGIEEWAVGYNDGNIVALKTDHPNPTTVFHELVHFWTIHYHIPWPIQEGYCELYADLCATNLGLYEVAYPHVDWAKQYEMLQEYRQKAPLNSFDYRDPGLPQERIDYFYLASTVIVYNFYDNAEEETLKKINGRISELATEGIFLYDKPGEVGILQYLRIAKEVSGVNYAELFIPIILEEWGPGEVKAFEDGVARYCAVSQLTQIPDSDEQMKLALTALVNGDFAGFQTAQQALVTNYYAQLAKQNTPPPTQTLPPIQEKKGLLHNKFFLFGLGMFAVGLILLIYVLPKLLKEEEELEWEKPRSGTYTSPGKSGLWAPPVQPSEPSELFRKEPSEDRPEIPDLQELTK